MGKSEIDPIAHFMISPENYDKHNFLVFCNNVLVSILKYADQNKLSSTQIQFTTSAERQAFNNFTESSDDWQDWLYVHGHKTELYETYFKHTFFSLIADFCSYLSESINSAAKMKVAVSYALLRKPLKDTLGCLEWLFADRNEFLNILVNGTPKDLEITKPKAYKHTSYVEEKLHLPSYFNFRYNKTTPTSLEHIWNNANHLVTTKYSISKTHPGSLNFIFTAEKDLRRYSDYYYLTVPAIMSYVISLVCEMFEGFTLLSDYTIAMNQLNRCVKMQLLAKSSTQLILPDVDLPIVCPSCGFKMEMTKTRMLKFAAHQYICFRCYQKIHTDRYIFDWED